MSNTIARCGLFALSVAMMAPCAHAQDRDSDIIMSRVKEQYDSLKIADFKYIYEGPIDKLPGTVFVVSYSIEFPSPDYMKSTELEIFTLNSGRIARVPMKNLPIGQVQSVSVKDGLIFVDTKTFRDDDPPCCPTDSHNFVFAPTNGALRGKIN